LELGLRPSSLTPMVMVPDLAAPLRCKTTPLKPDARWLVKGPVVRWQSTRSRGLSFRRTMTRPHPATMFAACFRRGSVNRSGEPQLSLDGARDDAGLRVRSRLGNGARPARRARGGA